MPEVIEAAAGGKRFLLGERWDLIPLLPMRWIARVYAYGAEKYEPHNWKNLDFDGDQSPLSHGIAHAFEAGEWPKGSPERCWLLAKTAWNVIAQLWHELTAPESKAEAGYADLIEKLRSGESELG